MPLTNEVKKIFINGVMKYQEKIWFGKPSNTRLMDIDKVLSLVNSSTIHSVIEDENSFREILDNLQVGCLHKSRFRECIMEAMYQAAKLEYEYLKEKSNITSDELAFARQTCESLEYDLEHLCEKVKHLDSLHDTQQIENQTLINENEYLEDANQLVGSQTENSWVEKVLDKFSNNELNQAVISTISTISSSEEITEEITREIAKEAAGKVVPLDFFKAPVHQLVFQSDAQAESQSKQIQGTLSLLTMGIKNGSTG